MFVAGLSWCAVSAPVRGAGGHTEIIAYDCTRDNGAVSSGDCWHSNEGGQFRLRVKASDHQWHGDWDTQAMKAQLGDCPYDVTYKLLIVPDGNTGAHWPASACTVRIAAVWSENDWAAADGLENLTNYNWSNPTVNKAATYLYAQDIKAPGTGTVVWTFPGNAGEGYAREVDCTFLGTFLEGGDCRDGYTGNPLWHPWTNEVRSLANTGTFQITGGTEGTWVEADLDQAVIDDLYDNADNRGLVVYNLPPDDFLNHGVRTKEHTTPVGDRPTSCPHIQATVHDIHDADANLDGEVDVLDLTAFANNFGQPDPAWGDADFNGDGEVDVLDLTILANNFGWKHPALGGGGQVPEPVGLVLVLAGAGALLRRRRAGRAGRS